MSFNHFDQENPPSLQPYGKWLQEQPKTMNQEPQEKRIGQFITSAENDKALPALLKAMQDMEAAAKDTKNEYYKSKYADLTSCLNVVKPQLTANGLALAQPWLLSDDSKSITVSNVILHTSGQYVRWDFVMPISEKLTPQEVGKTGTYARRYSLSAVGIMTDEDDDGNSGSGIQQDNRPRPQTQQRQAPKQQEAKSEPKATSKAQTVPDSSNPTDTQATADPSHYRDEEFDNIVNELAELRKTSVHTILDALTKFGIIQENIEDQKKFLRYTIKNPDMIMAVGARWQKSGKSFKECLADINEDVSNLKSLPWTTIPLKRN